MSDPTAFRRRVLAAGFSPLPLIGKRPVFDDWQKRLDVTEHEIEVWSRTAPAATNTGILTARVPALDIDVLDPEAAAAVEALAKERFEEIGLVLVRFGRYPKRALLFRCDEPFAKITIPLIAPGGALGQRLEFLANGQQIVVDGIHPDTGQPYDWYGGVPGTIKRGDLAYLHGEQAAALIADASALLCADFGYQRERQRQKKPSPNGADPTDWVIDFADHDQLAALAMKLLRAGLHEGAAVNYLRDHVQALTIRRPRPQGAAPERNLRHGDERAGEDR